MEHEKDVLYKFLQEPSREKFTQLVLNGTGEQNNLDFKEKWIDFGKIAEIILGIANSGGGAIVIGVKENENGTLESIGINKIEDKAKIHSKIAKFLPDNIEFRVDDFDYSGEDYSQLKDKKFQVIMINSERDKLPYVWNKDSNGAEVGCIFIRRGTKTCKANCYELEHLLEQRIRATYSEGSSLELKEHLCQLKVLYESIERQKSYIAINKDLFRGMKGVLGTHVSTQMNDYYPKESYDQFIHRLIEKKKLKIEKVLDLK